MEVCITQAQNNSDSWFIRFSTHLICLLFHGSLEKSSLEKFCTDCTEVRFRMDDVR